MHQLVSNLRAIADLFTIPITRLEYIVISSKIRVNNCYLMIYEHGGGGVDLKPLPADLLSISHFPHSRYPSFFFSHDLSSIFSNACPCLRLQDRQVCYGRQAQPTLIYIRVCHLLFSFLSGATCPHAKHKVSHRIPTCDCPTGFLRGAYHYYVFIRLLRHLHLTSGCAMSTICK